MPSPAAAYVDAEGGFHVPFSPTFPSLRSAALALTLLAAMPLAHAKEPGHPDKQSSGLKYVGVNLSGAEFNSRKKPGTLFKDYTYPSAADFSYFAGKGMNTIRLPFLWERLQPQLSGDLDPAQLALLKKAVAAAKANKQYLILDVHNYAKYNGKRIGSSEVPTAAVADLWRRLALEFKDDSSVIFGLMNEPNGISATDWATAAQGAINAIRKTGARNLILVPGTAYSGAHSWRSASYGVSNAKALKSSRTRATTWPSKRISIWTTTTAAPSRCAPAPRSAKKSCAASPPGCARTSRRASWANSAPPTTRSVTRHWKAC